jgi:hypothetical protein
VQRAGQGHGHEHQQHAEREAQGGDDVLQRLEAAAEQQGGGDGAEQQRPEDPLAGVRRRSVWRDSRSMTSAAESAEVVRKTMMITTLSSDVSVASG